MEKIPTLFVRDETQRGHPVTPVVKPECQWVLDGEGIATRKLDGANVKIENGQLFKRQKPKDRDYDYAAYVPCDRANPSDRWFWEGFDQLAHPENGIYEAIGPKIQGAERGLDLKGHRLVRVVPPAPWLILDDVPRTFEGLRQWLTRESIEGIVFHHSDGRLAKIKRRDFGLPWPVDHGKERTP